jgi:hypothetical protein
LQSDIKTAQYDSPPFHRRSDTDIGQFLASSTNKSDSELQNAAVEPESILQATLHNHHNQLTGSGQHSSPSSGVVTVRRSVSSRESAPRSYWTAPAAMMSRVHHYVDDPSVAGRRRAAHRRRGAPSVLGNAPPDDVPAGGAAGDVSAGAAAASAGIVVGMTTAAMLDAAAVVGAASCCYDDDDMDTDERFLLERAKCRQERLQMQQKKNRKRQPRRYRIEAKFAADEPKFEKKTIKALIL